VFGYLLFMVLILPSIGLTTMRAFVEDVVKVSRKFLLFGIDRIFTMYMV
jgi:hypothetical protein